MGHLQYLRQMNLKNLKYTKDHEWVRIEDDIAYVGITDFAQGELGDIVYVEIETLNETIEMSDVFGTVEAVKTVSDLFMPIAGETDPYGEGWIVKIKYNNVSQLDSLLDLDGYESITK